MSTTTRPKGAHLSTYVRPRHVPVLQETQTLADRQLMSLSEAVIEALSMWNQAKRDEIGPSDS